MEMWDVALKEHVKDSGCEVAESTMASCLRRLVPTALYQDLQKMSHIVRYSDAKKYIIDQVGLRLCYDQKRSKGDPHGVKPMDTSLAEHCNDENKGETLGNDESDLHALKGRRQKAKGKRQKAIGNRQKAKGKRHNVFTADSTDIA